MKLLNIGCGVTFHPDWINIDMVSSSPDVHSCDIRRNLPYPDNYFDACYSSHVIEHLNQKAASKLIVECRRVLKHQGIIRIVVPDLESIAKNYLYTLEQIESGITEAEFNYDWMMLELYDQTVRSFGGGEMARYLAKPNIPNKYFVSSRIGIEAEKAWARNAELENKNKSFWGKIKYKKPHWFIDKFKIILAKHLVALIAGNQARQGFEEGLFRNSGEIHQWMYDRFSLQRLLKQSGFIDVYVCRAEESRIPDFNAYNLDVIESKARKPDSLFMEGVKQ